jgi:hypothetical protein
LEFRENPRIDHAESALCAAVAGQKLGIGGEFDAGIFMLVVGHETIDEFQIGRAQEHLDIGGSRGNFSEGFGEEALNGRPVGLHASENALDDLNDEVWQSLGDLRCEGFVLLRERNKNGVLQLRELGSLVEDLLGEVVVRVLEPLLV